MASSDDTVEGSVSSLLVDSLKSNQFGDDLSPEEIAWVDSCLVKDIDVSDGDWSSMKDALIEILGLQPKSVASHDTAAPVTNGVSGGADIEMLHSIEPGTFKSSGRSDDDSISVQNNDKEVKTINDDFPVKEEADNSLSQQFDGDLSEASLRNAFLPNYREDKLSVGDSVSSGNDIIDSSTYETEPLTQDIFKVWDLAIPSEEDELVKQLNKALSETSDQLMPSTTNDSRAWRDLKELSLDDLITGIAELSLNQHAN